MTNAISQKDLVTATKFFFFALSVNLSQGLLWQINNFKDRVAFIRLQNIIGLILHKKISSLDLSIIESSPYQAIINKIQDGWGWKPINFLLESVWLIRNLLQILIAIYIISQVSFWYIPIIALSLLPSLINSLKLEKEVWGIWDAKSEVKTKYYRTQDYLKDSKYLYEIKIFGLQAKLLETMRELYARFANDQFAKSRSSFYISLATKVFEVMVFIIAEYNLVQQAIAGNITLAGYLFASSSLYTLSASINDFFTQLQRVYTNNLWMSDFYKLLDTKNQLTWASNAKKISSSSIPTIEFKNVSFKYPNTPRYIYRNLNLKLNPGEDIALVGKNGAGKTTLVKLLCRFYDVTSGEILINGTNIKDINLDTWYRNLGILFQDFNKYAYTVEENIQLGKVNKKITQKELLAHSKTSGAWEFISKFPTTFQQTLSKSYDGGIDLSGGQWQRLALARAFYRNANILVLDEPTSAIDAKGEYEIFQKINRIQAKKTTIIISHRFSTVRKADKIYVVEKGRITESGSHQELMQKEGTYHKMFTLQAEGYKD